MVRWLAAAAWRLHELLLQQVLVLKPEILLLIFHRSLPHHCSSWDSTLRMLLRIDKTLI